MPDVTCSHIGAITTVKHAKRHQCDECPHPIQRL